MKRRSDLENKIVFFENQLKGLEKEEDTKDEENKIKKQLKQSILRRTNAIEELQEIIKNIVNITIEQDKITLQRSQLLNELSKLKSEDQQFEMQLVLLKQKFEDAKLKFDLETRKARSMKADAEKKCDLNEQTKQLFETVCFISIFLFSYFF